MHQQTELITSIYREARERKPDAFIRWVFETIPTVLPCASQSWFYFLPDRATKSLEILSDDIHGIDNVEQFVADYNSVKTWDPLTWKTAQTPAKAFFLDIDATVEPIDPQFVAFARKYDIPKSLMMSFEVPRTKTRHLYVLMRGQSATPFTTVDAASLEQLLPHLIQARIHCREFALKSRMLDYWSEHNAIATLTDSGQFTDIENRFADFVRNIWPQTKDGDTPDELIDLLNENNVDNRTLRKEAIMFRHTVVNSMNLIVATDMGPLSRLSDREIEIGQLFADGDDHKMIATRINRSAATVRNHLRNIYQKLGVKSRSELAEVLSRLSPLR